MSSHSRWLLPDGVDELLPREAAQLETLRRNALDLFASWGYQLCVPPFVEFLDSLLSGLGEDLELQTFKVTDQISGRMLGIPADITPQIARIDAHRLATEAPRRLCYAGPTLHTRPEKFAGSRNPFQIGAELYGHAGAESDAEVASLMLELLARSGVPHVTLELAHMSIFRELVTSANIDVGTETVLRDALLRKASGELDDELLRAKIATPYRDAVRALLSLNGDETILLRARELLSGAPLAVQAALATLQSIVDSVKRRCPAATIHIDLAELRGYRYHTGVLFAAYTPTLGRAFAWGGRYDNVGGYFGRARPATGFSTDLKLLAALSTLTADSAPRIFAPHDISPALAHTITSIRASGRIVIEQLPGQKGGARELGCTQQLVLVQGQWQIKDL